MSHVQKRVCFWLKRPEDFFASPSKRRESGQTSFRMIVSSLQQKTWLKSTSTECNWNELLCFNITDVTVSWILHCRGDKGVRYCYGQMTVSTDRSQSLVGTTASQYVPIILYFDRIWLLSEGGEGELSNKSCEIAEVLNLTRVSTLASLCQNIRNEDGDGQTNKQYTDTVRLELLRIDCTSLHTL